MENVSAPWAKQPFAVNPFPDPRRTPTNTSTARPSPSPRSIVQEHTRVEETIGATGIEIISEVETTESSTSDTSEGSIIQTNRQREENTRVKQIKEFPILRRALTENQDENRARPVITEVRPVTLGSGLDFKKIFERKKRGLSKNAPSYKEEISGEEDAENREKNNKKREKAVAEKTE